MLVSRIDASPIFTSQVYFSQESFSCELLEAFKESSEARLVCAWPSHHPVCWYLNNGPRFGFGFFLSFSPPHPLEINSPVIHSLKHRLLCHLGLPVSLPALGT